MKKIAGRIFLFPAIIFNEMKDFFKNSKKNAIKKGKMTKIFKKTCKKLKYVL